MAKKHGTTHDGSPHDGAAMSFGEIAKALGISRGLAWMTYKSGMRKLQRPYNRKYLAAMLELAKSKENG